MSTYGNFEQSESSNKKMSIEEVFKIMWSRIQDLEGKLGTKEKESSSMEQNDSGLPSEYKNTINSLNSKVNKLSDQLSVVIEEKQLLKERLNSIIPNMQELSFKYKQLNNFLLEIQTTQLTINNQILKKFNDSNGLQSMIEHTVEERVQEKYLDNSNKTETDPECMLLNAETTGNTMHINQQQDKIEAKTTEDQTISESAAQVEVVAEEVVQVEAAAEAEVAQAIAEAEAAEAIAEAEAAEAQAQAIAEAAQAVAEAEAKVAKEIQKKTTQSKGKKERKSRAPKQVNGTKGITFTIKE